jgi:hypothetical protein
MNHYINPVKCVALEKSCGLCDAFLVWKLNIKPREGFTISISSPIVIVTSDKYQVFSTSSIGKMQNQLALKSWLLDKMNEPAPQ